MLYYFAMDIYFLRHGETMWNREKRIQGITPHIDLTDFGVQLAEMTRDGMIARGLTFDRIYTSPLKRALHTAEIICSGLGIAPIQDERLRERSFGIYEGCKLGAGNYIDDNLRKCFEDPVNYVAVEGEESFLEVEERFAGFLNDELMPLEGKCESVLLVTHGAFMRSAMRYLLKFPLADYWKGRQPNCCVHHAKLENGKCSVIEQSAVFYDKKLADAVSSG